MGDSMILLTLGYFIMGLTFLILRFVYHIVPKKNSPENFIHAVKNDFANLHDYAKQIILSHPKKLELIAVIIIVLVGLLILIPQVGVMGAFDFLDVLEYALSMIMFFLLVIIFAPKENPLHKGFPIEIFGFIYSIVFMFYSASALVVSIFFVNDIFKESVWIYGYCVTVIAYVICIATLSRFMERNLSRGEIILLGMLMVTTLEFITYYGVGFFGRIQNYNPQAYESNIFGDMTNVINQGLFIASQSQILERSAMEVWGYIILNGTDVLTITAVLGYLVQKFIENKNS
ncbi:MAG: hypothetical protein IJQ16_07255 [Selenomonadaceae bacterium]|nr:hypothetical protein [Selenomonadaceae bacterium]